MFSLFFLFFLLLDFPRHLDIGPKLDKNVDCTNIEAPHTHIWK